MAESNFYRKVKEWDARFNFPRPAEEQHLSSYRAFLRLAATATSGLSLLLSASVSTLLLFFSLYRLSLSGVPLLYTALGAFFFLLLIGGLLIGDLGNLTLPYTRLRQRETFGTARRATIADLKSLGILVRRHSRPEKPMICVGTFGAFYCIAFDLDQISGHLAVFGPPRCGKTVSIFMPFIRQWAPYGSCVALDAKGELSKYTSHYYEEVYRIDLENPQASDRLPLLAEIRDNPEAAGALCALMVNINPNKKTGDNPFWKDMAVFLGKALFLHLASVIRHPTPAHALQFLGTHPRKGGIDYLHLALSRSTDRRVREAWNSFHGYDLKLQAGVIATLMSTLDQFNLPSAQVVFSAPTEEDQRRGVKRIDLAALRRPGTIIYIVIGEGKAKTVSHVLGTIYGAVSRSLEAMQEGAYECPCLMAIDEAGNIFIDGLTDRANIGRGLGIFYLLGYQSKTQPEEQYGQLAGASLLQAINVKILMAGINAETAEWASRLAGTTTVMQHSKTDAVHDALDNERLAETGRPLIEPSAFREMLQHRQAFMLVTGAPFIPFALLENAKASDPQQSMPPHYNFDEPPTYIDLQGKAWAELKREVELALDEAQGDPVAASHLLARWTEEILKQRENVSPRPARHSTPAASSAPVMTGEEDSEEEDEEETASPQAEASGGHEEESGEDLRRSACGDGEDESARTKQVEHERHARMRQMRSVKSSASEEPVDIEEEDAEDKAPAVEPDEAEKNQFWEEAWNRSRPEDAVRETDQESGAGRNHLKPQALL